MEKETKRLDETALGEAISRLLQPGIFFTESGEDFLIFAEEIGKRLDNWGQEHKSLTPAQFVELLKKILTDQDFLEKQRFPFELYLFSFVPTACRIFPEDFKMEAIELFEQAIARK